MQGGLPVSSERGRRGDQRRALMTTAATSSAWPTSDAATCDSIGALVSVSERRVLLQTGSVTAGRADGGLAQRNGACWT
jgi:hypothetical protein